MGKGTVALGNTFVLYSRWKASLLGSWGLLGFKFDTFC